MIKKVLYVSVAAIMFSFMGSMVMPMVNGGNVAHAQTFTCHKCDSWASEMALHTRAVPNSCSNGGNHKWCPDGSGHRNCGATIDKSAATRPLLELGRYGKSHRYFVVWDKDTGKIDVNRWKAEIYQLVTDNSGSPLYHNSTFFYTFVKQNGEWIYTRDERAGKDNWIKDPKYYKVATDRLANDILYAIMHH